jgi:hypothetical protein
VVSASPMRGTSCIQPPCLSRRRQGSSERVQELGPVLDAVHHTRAA